MFRKRDIVYHKAAKWQTAIIGTQIINLYHLLSIYINFVKSNASGNLKSALVVV